MPPDAGRSGLDRSTLAAFVVMCVAAGGNAVAIRYITGAGDLDPFWAASSRFFLAALIFAVIARLSRASIPHGRALVGVLLYGALNFGGFFGFGYWGLSRVPASIGGPLLASGPLFTFLLAVAHRQERFRWDGLLGGAFAIGGIAVIFRGSIDEGVPLTGLLALVAATACGAEASIVVKAIPRVHPAAVNAIGMGVGTAILLIVTIALGESYALPKGDVAWTAQAYLIVAGSVLVFALYLFVLNRWTASAVSYEFVVIPLVTIVLSAWLLDEKITRSFATGAALVLIGVYFGALRQQRVREPVS